MTDTECNKFLTLLMGECWHEWGWSSGSTLRCRVCNIEVSFLPDNPDHLSNPLPVIKWMEKEMPEVLESFLDTEVSKWKHRNDTYPITGIFLAQLDLRNLVNYLYENPEWGISQCQHNCDTCWRRPETRNECREKGKITHPALAYLRSIKEEKEND